MQKMGRIGADGIMAELKARGKNSGKVRVLTHCNTGSLATAAYGTALGVVRSLHETGQLAHAYCTETRPYNQGTLQGHARFVTKGEERSSQQRHLPPMLLRRATNTSNAAPRSPAARIDPLTNGQKSQWRAGSRLTAYELVHDGLAATLIVDSAAAALMAQSKVDAVVVGADRIAANGDTANKIGTYSLAVNAAQHG